MLRATRLNQLLPILSELFFSAARRFEARFGLRRLRRALCARSRGTPVPPCPYAPASVLDD
eukprot:8058652-Pyramimonas_sp.AAC.1